MKLSTVYDKILEIYKVGKKLNFTDKQISSMEILSNKKGILTPENFRLILKEDFIEFENIKKDKAIKLSELVSMFNNIKTIGNSSGLKDLQIGKFDICKLNKEKTKKIEIFMDLEVLKIHGRESFFVLKTEITKSGIII